MQDPSATIGGVAVGVTMQNNNKDELHVPYVFVRVVGLIIRVRKKKKKTQQPRHTPFLSHTHHTLKSALPNLERVVS